MTSNLPGDPQDFFRPEFINRIDEIVRFRPLELADLRPIVGMQIERLKERMADRKLDLELTDAALNRLATLGYDPAFGARPLRRVVQRELAARLAMLLLSGEVEEGRTVLVDVAGDDFTISVRALVSG